MRTSHYIKAAPFVVLEVPLVLPIGKDHTRDSYTVAAEVLPNHLLVLVVPMMGGRRWVSSDIAAGPARSYRERRFDTLRELLVKRRS
jgi:hypothetical protein